MEKTIIILLAIGLLLSGCIGGPKACTEEAKLCPDGSYVGRTGPDCEFSPCPSSNSTLNQLADRNCTKSEDCMLVNSELNFSCCWAGACEPIDLMQPKWIAVNKAWFENQRSLNCPSQCGPAPGCPTRIINGNYTAACIAGGCIKEAN